MDSSFLLFLGIFALCALIWIAAVMPRREKTVKPDYVDDWAPRASQYAAGRAPSPLTLRAAEKPMQFAQQGEEGSPLPHELLRV